MSVFVPYNVVFSLCFIHELRARALFQWISGSLHQTENLTEFPAAKGKGKCHLLQRRGSAFCPHSRLSGTKTKGRNVSTGKTTVTNASYDSNGNFLNSVCVRANWTQNLDPTSDHVTQQQLGTSVTDFTMTREVWVEHIGAKEWTEYWLICINTQTQAAELFEFWYVLYNFIYQCIKR